MAEENTPVPGELPKEPELDATDSSALGSTDVNAAAPSGAVRAAAGAALTPGQRLAAKKAQKAVDKREAKDERKRLEEEKRQKEIEEAERIFGRPQVEPALPQNVERVAGTFTHFLQDNKERIVLGVLGALLLAGAALGVQRMLKAGSVEQAEKLTAALEIATAPIDPDDADGKTDDGKPLFKSEQARSEKALAALSGVVSEGKDKPAGRWAQLASAASELSLGKIDEARAHFQSVYDASGEEPELAGRALEGVAIAQEAAGKQDEALKSFEKLRTVSGQKELADYHVARIKLQKGDQEGGKELLKALYEQFMKPTTGEPVQPHAYLKSEVELRLAELDSSLVTKGGLAPGSMQMMDEAQSQRLIEQLSKKGKPGAGAE